MNTKEINAIVRPAYDALDVLNSIKWTPYRDRCRELAEMEERDHRRGKPDGVRLPDGASVAATARMFVVKRIAEALLGERPLTVQDYLHVQRSAFYAQSLVANYRDEIVAAWKGQDYRQLADLDYVAFINNGEKHREHIYRCSK